MRGSQEGEVPAQLRPGSQVICTKPGGASWRGSHQKASSRGGEAGERASEGKPKGTGFSKLNTAKSFPLCAVTPPPPPSHRKYLPHPASILTLYCQSLHLGSKSIPTLFLGDDKFFCIKGKK
uniref:Uncharacterized protein n=1 Tax=Rousettus aegyptiacus TaxID=9407 RepID=A0A7J8E8Y3_ROUAE|nr:hypothetical protein HJG63_008143 [Rousettus aegyptiacus]